jgi:hypothetical protein
MQDIYTSFFFVAFILIIVLAGVQAVTVLDQTGIIQSGISVASVQSDDLNLSAADMLVDESRADDECEIIYQLASQGSEHAVGYPYAGVSSSAGFLNSRHASVISSEAEQDDMGSLYYAVYTCSGISVIADGYI